MPYFAPLLRDRTVSITSAATPTINTDLVDEFEISALATNITSFTTNLSGAPINSQRLIIKIFDSSGHTLTWGSAFSGSSLPTATNAGKYLHVLLKYNSLTSKWECMATQEI